MDLNRFGEMRDSYITFNGLQSMNGIHWLESKTSTSWDIRLDQLTYGKNGFEILHHYNKDTTAKISTTSSFITVPRNNIMTLITDVLLDQRGFQQDSSRFYFIPNFRCMDLELQPLIFTIGDLEFSIPSYFYTLDRSEMNLEDNTRLVENRCYLLFNTNDDSMDESFTFGLPFVQAYNVLFDFQKNKIGF